MVGITLFAQWLGLRRAVLETEAGMVNHMTLIPIRKKKQFIKDKMQRLGLKLNGISNLQAVHICRYPKSRV